MLIVTYLAGAGSNRVYVRYHNSTYRTDLTVSRHRNHRSAVAAPRRMAVVAFTASVWKFSVTDSDCCHARLVTGTSCWRLYSGSLDESSWWNTLNNVLYYIVLYCIVLYCINDINTIQYNTIWDFNLERYCTKGLGAPQKVTNIHALKHTLEPFFNVLVSVRVRRSNGRLHVSVSWTRIAVRSPNLVRPWQNIVCSISWSQPVSASRCGNYRSCSN